MRTKFDIMLFIKERKNLTCNHPPFDQDCFDFNYFLTVIGISIYKSYYVSEQKTKNINVLLTSVVHCSIVFLATQ
jgi:hypothetical protein